MNSNNRRYCTWNLGGRARPLAMAALPSAASLTLVAPVVTTVTPVTTTSAEAFVLPRNIIGREDAHKLDEADT